MELTNVEVGSLVGETVHCIAYFEFGAMSVFSMLSCVALSEGFLDSLSHFEYFAVTFV